MELTRWIRPGQVLHIGDCTIECVEVSRDPTVPTRHRAKLIITRDDGSTEEVEIDDSDLTEQKDSA